MKKMVCPYCDSDNILQDAWASWDMENQAWILEDITAGMAFCRDCDGEMDSVEEVELIPIPNPCWDKPEVMK